MCIVYTYIIHSFTLCVANARPSLSPGCLCPKCWRGIVLDGSTWFILVNIMVDVMANIFVGLVPDANVSSSWESVRKIADRASARPFLTSVWARAGIQSASEPWTFWTNGRRDASNGGQLKLIRSDGSSCPMSAATAKFGVVAMANFRLMSWANILDPHCWEENLCRRSTLDWKRQVYLCPKVRTGKSGSKEREPWARRKYKKAEVVLAETNCSTALQIPHLWHAPTMQTNEGKGKCHMALQFITVCKHNYPSMKSVHSASKQVHGKCSWMK